MTSYSLNFEDVILNRVFKDRSEGFYVDVGAANPELHNNTKHFSLMGWKGINIEPNSYFYSKLIHTRPRDININAAVSDKPGTLKYYEVIGSHGESTISKEHAEILKQQNRPVKEYEVKVLTLADVLSQYCANQTIDFLSIDVEGHERAVLSTMDFARWRPRIVVVEATEPGTNVPSHDKWEGLILRAGYIFSLFDGINFTFVPRTRNGYRFCPVPTILGMTRSVLGGGDRKYSARFRPIRARRPVYRRRRPVLYEWPAES